MHGTKKSSGQRLEQERLRLGKTQEEIAALSGVTRRTISRVENGENYAGGDLLETLAAHGFDSQYIITGVRSENLDRVAEKAGSYTAPEKKGVGAPSREVEALVDKYQQLDPGHRTHVQAIIDTFVATKVKKKYTG